jgi:hypothetical protein
MNLLTPGHPDAVSPRRGYRRTKYFARNELPRLTLGALRKASGPITAREIAAGAIRDKGLPSSAKEAETEMVLGTLPGALCGVGQRSRRAPAGTPDGPSRLWEMSDIVKVIEDWEAAE